VERLTYLALLLGWALPVVALHWLVGARVLRRNARLLVVAVLVPAIYLSLADAVAIGSGVWQISAELTLGLRLGSLILEEAIFFLLTCVMVAQSVVLFLSAEARANGLRLLRRLLRRPDRPPTTARASEREGSTG